MVLLGNGDGTFSHGTSFDLDFTSTLAPIVADFNGDGRSDLVAVDDLANSTGQVTVDVFLSTAAGAFVTQPAFDLGIPLAVDSVASGDFNGDGRPDLAVFAATGSQVELNAGAAQFVAPSALAATHQDNPVLADPGDGSNDVFEVDAAGDILWRKAQSGAPGSFAPPTTINTGTPARAIAVVTTRAGAVIAAVDRTDALTLYQYAGGRFVLTAAAHDGLDSGPGDRGRRQWRWQYRPGRPQCGRRHRFGLLRRRPRRLRSAGRPGDRPGRLGCRSGGPRWDREARSPGQRPDGRGPPRFPQRRQR